jgi:hypothetical protein
VALCAQGFPWLTLVEVLETLLLPDMAVKETGEVGRGCVGRNRRF